MEVGRAEWVEELNLPFRRIERPTRKSSTSLKPKQSERATGVRKIVLTILNRRATEPLAALPLVALQPSHPSLQAAIRSRDAHFPRYHQS